MTTERKVPIKTIKDWGLFRCNPNSVVLQVSHHLGGNRVVVKRPNERIIDSLDFAIFNGDKEVYEVKSNESDN